MVGSCIYIGKERSRKTPQALQPLHFHELQPRQFYARTGAVVCKRRIDMKVSYLILITILLTGCAPSAQQMTATAVMAQAQTETAAPTLTPTLKPTLTPTLTPTPTLTLTPTPKPSSTPVAGKDCKIVSLKPVADVEVPTIEILAEGFLPNEGRMITLMGKAIVAGTVQTIPAILAGGGGESADSEGRISQTVTLIPKKSLEQFESATGKWQFPDHELTVTVTGKQSGCEATQTVNWPDGLSTTPTP
jgi:hypothetical protein